MHPGIAHLAPTQHGLHGGNPATRFTYGWLADLATYRLSRESAVLGACVCLRGTVSETRMAGEPHVGIARDGWMSRRPRRGRRSTLQNSEGLSTSDLPVKAEPTANRPYSSRGPSSAKRKPLGVRISRRR